MKGRIVVVLIVIAGAGSWCNLAAADPADTVSPAEAMKDSIVYLETSAYGYSVSQPWKHDALKQDWACGCAVGPYEVVTPASRVADLAYAKAFRYAQNAFITARIRVVDYGSDLCLIQLDPNELDEPLVPLHFEPRYDRGAQVSFHWLTSDSHMANGRGYVDRARAVRVVTSHAPHLRYIIANTSRRLGRGEVYCTGSTPIGIGCWSSDDNETDVIPAETIRRFLADVADGGAYRGFGEVGFGASELRDPTMRAMLEMPASVDGGIYVADPFTLGTGCEVLKKGDVVLSIDDQTLNARGQYTDPTYGLLSWQHLITSKTAGQTVAFELWRDGQRQRLDVPVKSFRAADMLVPFNEYDRQPQYVILAGFVFQTLTRDYLLEFGDKPSGQAPSHLYHYYRDLAVKPTDRRRDIVVLSYVLPTPVNMGYTDLGQLVVEEFNGMPIASIADIEEALKRNPQSEYHRVEFELYNPTVVIPRQHLAAADEFVRRNYGIRQLSNLAP